MLVWDELDLTFREELREHFNEVHRRLMSEGTGIALERLNELHNGADPTREETLLTAKYLYGKEGAAEIERLLPR